MSALRQHIVIDAPADTVWEVIAGRFDRIGGWATAIPTSAPATVVREWSKWLHQSPRGVCETGIRALPRVIETIGGFDAANRTLTYQATEGMPAFVTAARNMWTATALGASQCRADIAAGLTTHGFLGWLARTVILTASCATAGTCSTTSSTTSRPAHRHLEAVPPTPLTAPVTASGPAGTVDVQGRQPASTVG